MTKNSAPPPITLETAQEFLREQALRIDIDPMTNSVFALTQTLFRDMEDGQASLSDLSKLANEVHLELLDDRADRFRAQHSGADEKAAWAPFVARLEATAAEGFEAFEAALVQQRGGIVFTGHPTFALSTELRAAFAAHVCKPTKATRAALAKLIKTDNRAQDHGTPADIHAEMRTIRELWEDYPAISMYRGGGGLRPANVAAFDQAYAEFFGPRD